MPEEFPEYVDVDYTDGEGESPNGYTTLDRKMQKAIEVTTEGLEEYDNPAVMWTGGKDSTLTLYFIKEVAEEYGFDTPTAVFIDHFQHFDDIIEFVEKWADEWGINVVYARNEDVRELADEPGDEVRVEDLNEQNQHHVRNILEYEDDTFPFLLDTYVGNHLLKTVPLNNAPISTRPTTVSTPSSSSTRRRSGTPSGTTSSPKPSTTTPTKATCHRDTTTSPKESHRTTCPSRPSTSRGSVLSEARYRPKRAHRNPPGYRTWKARPSVRGAHRTRRT